MNIATSKYSWLTGPVLFFVFLGVLLAVWAAVDPTALIRNFDADGRSPFELATLPFFAAIVPLVWWKCPFEGSRRRRTVLCLAVSVVAVMAIVKELDLHNYALSALFPDFVQADGKLVPGLLFKPNGDELHGTPFKMRVLTNGEVPLAMKALIVGYFALFFGVFAAAFAYLLPGWVKGVFRLEPPAWSFGCFGASGVMVQISDRLPSWLDNVGGLGRTSADGTETAASALCTVIEEGGELMIALFALLTIYQSYLILKKKASCHE